MARWSDLTEFLATAPDRCTLSMERLEQIVGPLPPSATSHRAWWSGDRPQVRAWRAAGFTLERIALGQELTLRRDVRRVSVVEPTQAAPTPREQTHASQGEGATADIVLVSCSARKGDIPAPAKDLYTSVLFRKQRAYAESTGAPWFILSAEHALVAPDEWLAPYDRYLPNTSPSYRAAWGAWVTERLESAVGGLRDLVVEIHASAAYVDAIAPFLVRKGVDVRTPLAGLRQGEQLAFYAPGTNAVSRNTVEAEIAGATPPIADVVSALRDSGRALTPAEFLAQGSAGLRSPGLYSWWVDAVGAEDLTRAVGVLIEPGLVYVGLAGARRWPSGKRSASTLWMRIADMHLGANHEFSTFRRTVGALLAALDGRDVVDEARLTAWMHDHLKVIPVVYGDADALGDVEADVLAALDPPLNLQGMPSTELRHIVSALRRLICP